MTNLIWEIIYILAVTSELFLSVLASSLIRRVRCCRGCSNYFASVSIRGKCNLHTATQLITDNFASSLFHLWALSITGATTPDIVISCQVAAAATRHRNAAFLLPFFIWISGGWSTHRTIFLIQERYCHVQRKSNNTSFWLFIFPNVFSSYIISFVHLFHQIIIWYELLLTNFVMVLSAIRINSDLKVKDQILWLWLTAIIIISSSLIVLWLLEDILVLGGLLEQVGQVLLFKLLIPRLSSLSKHLYVQVLHQGEVFLIAAHDNGVETYLLV